MKKKEREEFKEILLGRKKETLRHLDDLSGSSTEERYGSGDPADIASVEINQAALQKIGKRESFLLKKIDYALKKIEDDTFGECEECGEDIALARLRARPEAQLCIDCKTEQESLERRYRHDDGESEEGGDGFGDEE